MRSTILILGLALGGCLVGATEYEATEAKDGAPADFDEGGGAEGGDAFGESASAEDIVPLPPPPPPPPDLDPPEPTTGRLVARLADPDGLTADDDDDSAIPASCAKAEMAYEGICISAEAYKTLTEKPELDVQMPTNPDELTAQKILEIQHAVVEQQVDQIQAHVEVTESKLEAIEAELIRREKEGKPLLTNEEKELLRKQLEALEDDDDKAAAAPDAEESSPNDDGL